MKLLRPLFVVLCIIIGSDALTASLINDFLHGNNLKTLLLVSCVNHRNVDPIKTIFSVQREGIWINTLDISENEFQITHFDYDKFFIRLSDVHCVVMDLECNQAEPFLREISNRILFHYERSWLMVASNFNESYDILSRQNMNVDAEVSLAIPSADYKVRSEYDLHEIYNHYFKRSSLNVTRLGHWGEPEGLVVQLNEQTKTERRRNFQGITLTSVLTLRNIPENITFLEHLQSNDDPYLNNLGRISYRLFTLIGDIYNFNIHIRVASAYAHLDASGAWHGAIDLVNRRKAQFGLTPLRWENDRYGVIEHTTNSYHAQILIIFRHPKTVPSNTFILPFRTTLWYAIVGLVFLSACIVRNIFSVESHKKVKRSLGVEQVNEDTYSNSILMMFGFIVQQGYSGKIILTSSRILVFAVLTFALLIYQFYSSFIVGSLLIEAPKNIKTVKQLLNSPLSFGLDEQPYVVNNFLYAQEESVVRLYKTTMKHPERTLMSARTGLNFLKKGGFAFNTDGSYAYLLLKDTLTDSEKCDLQDIAYIPKVAAGPVVPNKSEYRELIKIALRRITETGLLSYYNTIFYGTRPKCEILEVIVTPVDLIHFSSALYLLGFGIIVSVMLLALEIIVRKRLTEKNCRESKLKRKVTFAKRFDFT